MLISNCKFFLTFTPTITPTIGLKCLVLKALYHCVISFFINFIFCKIRLFGKFILAKSEPHHAYSCHAYKKRTCIILPHSGTIFLWMYWPSFNGATLAAFPQQQNRAFVNTYLALTASCIMTFVTSPLLNKGWKMRMVTQTFGYFLLLSL